MKREYRNLTGKRFGSLICGERLADDPRKIVCYCDCGTEIIVWVANLTQGSRTLSCGATGCRKRNPFAPKPIETIVRSQVVERGQVATWSRPEAIEK